MQQQYNTKNENNQTMGESCASQMCWTFWMTLLGWPSATHCSYALCTPLLIWLIMYCLGRVAPIGIKYMAPTPRITLIFLQKNNDPLWHSHCSYAPYGTQYVCHRERSRLDFSYVAAFRIPLAAYAI